MGEKCKSCGVTPSYPGNHHKPTCPKYLYGPIDKSITSRLLREAYQNPELAARHGNPFARLEMAKRDRSRRY